ncbi:Bardet-Biedl syndrome 4 protein homolog isoform X1 [Apis mellifera]|uniref:Bardet-Biedl syndrome 4 protein homolog isoform X1 n=1 Tax=Apis mellifera TaxID=7460 RepID=A0A7M7IF66_APIME|nr:Bardet-Biedl syndrome 4 protein homolog isoform X1 [Apis mellifera]XP_016767911.1 Bardet-Biedl syndrome 4 protein homolog isoform X1 [Apis mellifera]XP_016767912.1 Bardet-Biedl syndrome 4 protein homolog isoform X1 [Apis mellifera]XP_016767913.1 Bardet-Biedl syndrome 4 protein homolog isoform X1 [Apis mellifera]XP_016767915.1 Bardet-Biedl syndrome 4 protein homolog isoform X1 [Apis mellifera]XP_016767916.1 Bardet-Biedl syndrome 4 protein homolog isoform X1 [Apis mellifera]|eukprot:XP_016767910.1 Bardet-Biedl syndrome 4 protein homolog isoform X1 [Apis mellifera]
MTNNIFSNGRIQQRTIVSQRLRNDKGKKAPEISAIESNNWLLHRHYTRHEYKTCKILIDQELIKSNGHNEYANYLKGLILRREGKIQDSLNYFQTAYNVNSTNINNVKQIAKSFLIMGNHKRAIDAYLEAEKISNISDWEIYFNLGECYMKLNQVYEAKKYLKRSIELTKNELPYIALAKLCLFENHVTEAQNAYTTALNENPESIEAATELGLLYLKIGDVQRAFQQFGTAIAHSPNYAKAILPVAYIIQNHQEYDVALSKYKQAAQSIPESYVLWNNVGMCFYGKQKFVAAISCLKRAHYLNSMAFLPAYNLGMVFLTTGQPASAAIYLCAAITADPKNSMPYLLLGIALKRLDDLEGAEKVLQKAHALSPQDPFVLINYAVILEAQGKGNIAAELVSALNDITAVIDVDEQITQTAKKLSMKLQQERVNGKEEEETRVLNSDEV